MHYHYPTLHNTFIKSSTSIFYLVTKDFRNIQMRKIKIVYLIKFFDNKN